MADLIVQASEHSAGGPAVIVLHERAVEAGGSSEIARIEILEEKSTVVAKDLRLQQKHLRQ
jgi:hypothetical protein